MEIGKALLHWYGINKRNLPWRNNNDAYSIWVSEIIMQQTRINQGLSYYLNFLNEFPTVFDLAKADEQKVMLIWQGLGYYSRARNMHETAKNIVDNYKGLFPIHSQELLKLKGVGKYTAAAISSICNNENIAAIDGNVIRVIARLYNITEAVNKNSTLKQIEKISYQLVKNTDAGTYNQAMMDLGAMVCTPKKPDCSSCPLLNVCMAKQNNAFLNIPFKDKKTVQKNRFLVYVVLKTNTHTLIGVRNNNDIWKGLYEFPLIELAKKTPIKTILENTSIKKYGSESTPKNLKIIEAPVHKLSHQTLHAHFVIISMNKLPKIKNYKAVGITELAQYPLPRLIEKQIENIFFA